MATQENKDLTKANPAVTKTEKSFEEMVKEYITNKKITKEQLSTLLEKYNTEKAEIKEKVKADVEKLSKEAWMDMLEKWFSISSPKDIKLFLDILSKNWIKPNIAKETENKILKTVWVVAIYSQDDKRINLYWKTGTRLWYINDKWWYEEQLFTLFIKDNEIKDDDVWTIKDKAQNETKAVAIKPNKGEVITASEQEIEDAKYWLNHSDKYTLAVVKEFYEKYKIDWLNKLKTLHSKMNEADIKSWLKEFSGDIDNSHMLLASKLITAYWNNENEIKKYLWIVEKDPKKAEVVAKPEEGWLSPDDIWKHTEKFNNALNWDNINILLNKENRPSYNYVMSNLHYKEWTVFNEIWIKFGEKLKWYIVTNYPEWKYEKDKLNIFLSSKMRPAIKVKNEWKDIWSIEIENWKFSLISNIPVKKVEATEDKTKEKKYTIESWDTLSKLAKWDKKLIQEIKDLNPDVNWGKLKIWQEIKVNEAFEKKLGIEHVAKWELTGKYWKFDWTYSWSYIKKKWANIITWVWKMTFSDWETRDWTLKEWTIVKWLKTLIDWTKLEWDFIDWKHVKWKCTLKSWRILDWEFFKNWYILKWILTTEDWIKYDWSWDKKDRFTWNQINKDGSIIEWKDWKEVKK